MGGGVQKVFTRRSGNDNIFIEQAGSQKKNYLAGLHKFYFIGGMKNMKTTVKTRTPRRVLAVFLSVLMLMSSLVFASPTVSKAAGRVTFDESKYGNYTQNVVEPSHKQRVGVQGWGGSIIPTEFYDLSYNASGFATESLVEKPYVNLNRPTYSTTNKLGTRRGDDGGTEDYGVKTWYFSNFGYGRLYAFYDYRNGVNNTQPQINGVQVPSSEIITEQYYAGGSITKYKYDFSVLDSNWGPKEMSFSVPNRGAEVTTSVDSSIVQPNFYYARQGFAPVVATSDTNYNEHYLHDDGLLITQYKFYFLGNLKITYCGVDTTELYNLYKELYVGYHSGYFNGTPLDVFAKGMYAAELVLQGKLDEKVTAETSAGGYGYSYICQNLIDAIVADLKSVELTVNFSHPITTRSDPADAATFSPITMPTNYKNGINITINVSERYAANNVRLIVKDAYGELGEYKPIGSSGSKYNFNVPITGDISEIVATGFKLKQYTVTVPSTRDGLKITGGGNTTVDWGSNYTFTVEVRDGYTRSTPNVKIGNTPVDCTKNGNIYTYTISSIKENKNVTIDNLSLNEYSVSYNLGTGTGKTSDSVTKLVHGKNGTVKITVGDAYTQRKPEPTVDKGAKLTPVSNDGKTYVYTLSGVIDDVTVTVPSLNKNTYTAVLPSGEGYTAKSNDDLANIVYGSSISFGIDLDEQYNRSKVVVKYNGTVLEPAGGVYTISNITNNITKDMITVEGVKLNDYYIALPLESQPGFTIEVGEGLNAKAVRSGTSFNFKLFLDPAYSQSDFTIKYSKDGGEHYTVLEKDSNGSYVIEPVLSDYIVVVDGVKKNTYT